jgi:pimeloyl-ACP methyl ester carboxylesterase
MSPMWHSWDVPTLQNNGQVVGYGVAGAPLGTAGLPVLLFHGTTMNRTAWDFVIGSMPTERTYIQVEFPGSGESAMPSAPLSVEGLVSDALAVIHELKVDRFHVAGYSLGAVIAAATAATVPERVASATMLCGWVTSDARMRMTFDLWKRLINIGPDLFMRYALVDGFTANALTGLEPMVEAMIGMTADAVAPGSIAHLDLDMIIDISAQLPLITAPCLVISGAQDRWVDPTHGHALSAGLKNSTFRTLPAGHLVIQEQAGDVAALVHEHLVAHS